MRRKIFCLLLVIFVCVGFISTIKFTVFAHSQMLHVSYDNCVSDNNGDGLDEMWYILNWDAKCYHISQATTTIKYYFEETVGDENGPLFRWGDYMTTEEQQEVKNAIANSMKKWNDVYFYSYDSQGNVIKNKIINIVEGTKEDHNLHIYPNSGEDIYGQIYELNPAETVGVQQDLSTGQTITHYHYSEWRMVVYVDEFLYGRDDPSSEVDFVRAATGAHEIGHILGLFDIDVNNICRSNAIGEAHHQELLMGYGEELENRSKNITYKDIAGVAITRGFHTDNDHKWLYTGQSSYGVHKLICSICNCVKEVNYLQGYSYNTYGSCESNHSLSSGNMMAVASYGNKDYYKCKFCRYVAPFDALVEQNYTDIPTNYSNNSHVYKNNVQGLEYYYIESHSHTLRYEKYTAGKHFAYCSCGDVITAAHVLLRPVGGTGLDLGICKYCGATVSFGVLDSIPSDYPHTENGSYILPNGIIVLVPEDEEAYFNGTIEFRTGEVM